MTGRIGVAGIHGPVQCRPDVFDVVLHITPGRKYSVKNLSGGRAQTLCCPGRAFGKNALAAGHAVKQFGQKIMMDFLPAQLGFAGMINHRDGGQPQLFSVHDAILHGTQPGHNPQQFVVIDTQFLGQDIAFPVPFGTAAAEPAVPGFHAHLGPFADARNIIKAHTLIGATVASRHTLETVCPHVFSYGALRIKDTCPRTGPRPSAIPWRPSVPSGASSTHPAWLPLTYRCL